MSLSVKLGESWKKQLDGEFKKPYFQSLIVFLKEEIRLGKTILPPEPELFAAFEHSSFENTKVVIIGQDPYHGLGQAQGLCFSVNENVRVPPSLRNIYKELELDIVGYEIPIHGDLTHWALQGVLLLNTVLTVEKDKAGSHQGKGWEQFTDEIIRLLSSQKKHLVFMLWGKYAQSKSTLIDPFKHLVLQAAHPSPFSAYRGFIGCKHFSKTNQYLLSQHLLEVRW